MTFWRWRHAVFFSVVLSLFTVLACSSRDVPTPPAPSEPMPITLAPVIGAEVNTSTTLPSAAPSMLPEVVKSPAVGVSGNTALVVWADGRSGVYSLFGARVDLDTKAVGKTIKIATGPSPRPFNAVGNGFAGNLEDIRVTAGATNFLVTWYDSSDFFEQPYLFGVRVPVDFRGRDLRGCSPPAQFAHRWVRSRTQPTRRVWWPWAERNIERYVGVGRPHVVPPGGCRSAGGARKCFHIFRYGFEAGYYVRRRVGIDRIRRCVVVERVELEFDSFCGCPTAAARERCLLV